MSNVDEILYQRRAVNDILDSLKSGECPEYQIWEKAMDLIAVEKNELLRKTITEVIERLYGDDKHNSNQ